MSEKLVVVVNSSYPQFSRYHAREADNYAVNKGKDIGTLLPEDLKAIFAVPSLKDNSVVDHTVRGMLSFLTFKYARMMGLPISVCDYNSSPDYLEAVFQERPKQEKNLLIIPQAGSTAGDAKREATEFAKIALNPENFLWTEAEKYTLFLWGKNTLPLPKNNQTLVILARAKSLFGLTYGDDQQLTEDSANLTLNWMMREEGLRIGEPDLDFMSGGRVFPRGKVADTMLDPDFPGVLKAHKYSGSYTHLMIPPFKLAQRGFDVDSAEVAYLHPAIQRNLEFVGEGNQSYLEKRVLQMEVIIRECAQYLGTPAAYYHMYINTLRQVVDEQLPKIEARRQLEILLGQLQHPNPGISYPEKSSE